MLLLYFSKSSYQIFKIHPTGSFRSVDNAVLSFSFSYILGWKFLSTHLLKLAECRYNANFSVLETGKAVKQIPMKILHNLNRSSCAKYCLVCNSTYYYFNLESTTGTCELLKFLNFPKPRNKNGWEFVRTNIYLRNVKNYSNISFLVSFYVLLTFPLTLFS